MAESCPFERESLEQLPKSELVRLILSFQKELEDAREFARETSEIKARFKDVLKELTRAVESTGDCVLRVYDPRLKALKRAREVLEQDTSK